MLVWIRLPTNQGLKLRYISILSRKADVWIRLPTNQGLKHLSYKMLQLSQFRSESDFQQIKDWNQARTFRLGFVRASLNPTSNKSRIETPVVTSLIFRQSLVWIRLPTNQGLKLKTSSLICAKYPVWIRLPTNQGLKQCAYRIETMKVADVWIRLPTNQGLKLGGMDVVESEFGQVWIRLPTNQGLKHSLYTLSHF